MDYSSACTSTPVFPLLKEYETLVATYHEAIKDSIRDNDLRDMGSGFLTLPERGTFGKLRDCLLCTAAIAVDLEKLKPYVLNSPSFRRLIRAARAVHHQLLSLPAETGDLASQRSGPESTLYQVIRLAALLYHDIVIFPHVDTSGIKPSLSGRMQAVLDERSLAGGGRHDRLVLWALLLGSIGATWTKYRQWFLDQLHDKSKILGIENFEQFKAMMSTCLWFENIDGPASRVWADIGQNNTGLP